MKNFLQQKTPEGRNRWWTLLFVILVPAPFILIMLNIVLGEWQKGNPVLDIFLALTGLLLFIILWARQVINGTYENSLNSGPAVKLFQFSGWGLVFVFAVLTNFLVKENLKLLGFASAVENSALLSLIFTLLSFLGWKTGALIKKMGGAPRTTEASITPKSVLEQSVLGMLSYMLVSLAVFLLLSALNLAI